MQTSEFGSRRDNEFDSALLTGRDGRHWIIRVPRTEAAEAAQSADIVALRAISAGIRTRLPFAVSTYVGQAPVSGTRAIVYEFVYGSKTSLREIDHELADSLGTAIAAIHNLPTSFVSDAGLPVLAQVESLRSVVSVMDRAAATGNVPSPLLSRWEAAAEDTKLWQFQPSVINNTLSADSVLTANGAVTGILGWQELRVGDPARDFAWLLGGPDESVIDVVFDAYAKHRGSADRQVRQRATLYSELEVAKWLLHGLEVRSTEIVDDAIEMLDGLVDDVRNDVMNPLGAQTMPTMAVDEVEAFLDRNERAV